MLVLGTKNNPDMPPGTTKSQTTTCPTITTRVPASAGYQVPELPAAEIEAAADYARAEKAAATIRAYKTDFAIFEAWCAERLASALPAVPEALCAFMAFEADRGIRPSTLSRRVAAIRHAHRLVGLELPTDDERVRAVMRGIRRRLSAAPRKKMPATSDRIVAMAPVASERLSQLRDRGLVLLGFASAMRRSELVALDIEDIEFVSGGLRVTIRSSKTDPEGHGAIIAIPHGSVACPVGALAAWIGAATITAGPIFRPIAKGQHIQNARLTDRSVANIVKAHAARVGLDPANFAGHSLRSGFLTSAAARGASIRRRSCSTRLALSPRASSASQIF
jgi:site-specific recombinase XerD